MKKFGSFGRSVDYTPIQILEAYGEKVITLNTNLPVTHIDLLLGNVFDVTLQSNTTVVFDNPPPTGILKSSVIIVRQDAVGSRFITNWTNTNWTDNNIPILKRKWKKVFVYYRSLGNGNKRRTI